MRKEVFKGQDANGAHRTGSEGAAFVILGYAAATYALFINDPNVLTGEQHVHPIWTSLGQHASGMALCQSLASSCSACTTRLPWLEPTQLSRPAGSGTGQPQRCPHSPAISCDTLDTANRSTA